MEAGYPRADGKETKAGRRFDVLKFYSSQQGALVPVHKTMAMVAFTAAETEADDERVFSFGGRVESSLRSCMDPQMTECWVELGFDWMTPEVRPTIAEIESQYRRVRHCNCLFDVCVACIGLECECEEHCR